MYPSSLPFLLSILPLIPAQQIPLNAPSPPRFPWIRKFASIGDSYASGLGSGSRIDWSCSRYSSSYPHILHTSLLGDDANRTHQFLACSGASSSMILDSQVSQLDAGLDLLTISAGGNDIGLTPVLNNCVYQFYMSGEDDCETAIRDAQDRIADPALLYKNVGDVVTAAKAKMAVDGVIVLTGYARFFGAEDAICDNVTWAVWGAVEAEKQYLRREMRSRLNALVHSVNMVLRSVAQAAGPNVLFANYDSAVEKGRGRYCELGVQEPAPNRASLVFYEWNTVDRGENRTKLQHRTGGNVPRNSFESGIAERINRTLEEHPEWTFDPDKGFVDKDNEKEEEEQEQEEEKEEGIVGGIEDGIHWLLPDSWKRVFHLRPEGHAVVARSVMDVLEQRRARSLKPICETGLVKGFWWKWLMRGGAHRAV